MMLNKMSLDFFVKMKVVFGGILKYYEANNRAEEGKGIRHKHCSTST
jgi:hypothetical protein